MADPIIPAPAAGRQNAEVPQESRLDRFERRMGGVLRGYEIIVAFLIGLVISTIAVPLSRVFSRSLDGAGDVARRFPDPFWLKKYGDSLLTPAVELEIGVRNLLLAAVMGIAAFAWVSIWMMTGMSSLIVIFLAVCCLIIEAVIERSHTVLDDPGGFNWKRVWVFGSRFAMLFFLSLVNSVPTEIRVFAPEINERIELQEKVKIDEIREKALAYERDLVEKRDAATGSTVDAQTDDLLAHRREERAAILADQQQARASIERRLQDKGRELAAEISQPGDSGDGPEARSMRNQEAQIRKELTDFNAESRKQLADFDAATEQMRSGVANTTLEEQRRREEALDAKLHEIEVMPAAELAAKYGGTYREPDGFMARFRVLDEIVNVPPPPGRWFSAAALVVLGVRLVMLMVGFSPSYAKIVMSSPELKAYYSTKCQALAGHAGAVQAIVLLARDGDAEALDMLRKLALDRPECRELLTKLGYDVSLASGTWSDEVRQLNTALFEARIEMVKAFEGFKVTFRGWCHERWNFVEGEGDNQIERRASMPRTRLAGLAEPHWNQTVLPKLMAMRAAEQAMLTSGVPLPADWNVGFGEDPRRHNLGRFWDLSDTELAAQFGWIDPRPTVPAVVSDVA